MKEEKIDHVNPDHYKPGPMEVIEMMEALWGREKLIAHCEMTNFKYRMRAGLKPDQPVERDLAKAKWYKDKAEELKKQMPIQQDDRIVDIKSTDSLKRMLDRSKLLAANGSNVQKIIDEIEAYVWPQDGKTIKAKDVFSKHHEEGRSEIEETIEFIKEKHPSIKNSSIAVYNKMNLRSNKEILIFVAKEKIKDYGFGRKVNSTLTALGAEVSNRADLIDPGKEVRYRVNIEGIGSIYFHIGAFTGDLERKAFRFRAFLYFKPGLPVNVKSDLVFTGPKSVLQKGPDYFIKWIKSKVD